MESSRWSMEIFHQIVKNCEKFYCTKSVSADKVEKSAGNCSETRLELLRNCWLGQWVHGNCDGWASNAKRKGENNFENLRWHWAELKSKSCAVMSVLPAFPSAKSTQIRSLWAGNWIFPSKFSPLACLDSNMLNSASDYAVSSFALTKQFFFVCEKW